MPHKKRVSILGCGWFGLSLAKGLAQNGYAVKGSTTSPEKLSLLAEAGIEPYLINFSADGNAADALFFDADVLWICIPPKVRSGKGGDFLLHIARIIEAVKPGGIKQVVFISSTGVYGDINAAVDEFTRAIPDSKSGRVLLQAEGLLIKEDTFQTTVIRFAGLIGPGRQPGGFFAGKKELPNGKAPVNLIHLSDCLGISLAIMEQQAFGQIYNGCSPYHPAKAEFYTEVAKTSGLELPEFIDELLNWKIVNSTNTQRILGYRYEVVDLLNHLYY